MSNKRESGFRMTVLHSTIRLTVEEALEIQADQLAFYEPQCPGISAKVKSVTLPFKLEPGVEYPIEEINKWIPRGLQIETLMHELRHGRG